MNIIGGGSDPRIGNQRHQRLVQQIMGQYQAKKQAQNRVGALGGVRGAGPAAGTGMLNKFAKRSAGPNVTNPMSMSITAALRNALGPGGAGIPGAHEHSMGQGQGADFNFGPGGASDPIGPGGQQNIPGQSAGFGTDVVAGPDPGMSPGGDPYAPADPTQPYGGVAGGAPQGGTPGYAFNPGGILDAAGAHNAATGQSAPHVPLGGGRFYNPDTGEIYMTSSGEAPSFIRGGTASF